MVELSGASRIVQKAAARIKEADAKAVEADYAFAAGKFDEYWQRESEAAIKRIQDEYSRSTEAASGGASGGNQPDAGLSEDDRSGPPQ